MVGSSTFSIIGPDVLITGNISAKVDLHVDGRVDGDISCASLVQGEASTIHGAIHAEAARLSGTVNGSVDARELIITATAHVTGDISYETITIEQGGHVDGQFRHRSKAATPASPALGNPAHQADDNPTLLLSNS
jgi:cytoskeletal protein CcmA (bactofilin family)